MIKLRGQYELLSNADLDKFCTAMVQKLRPCHELEWVHISGLIDPGAVMGFAPAIERLKSSDVDDKEAQIDITTCWYVSCSSYCTISAAKRALGFLLDAN